MKTTQTLTHEHTTESCSCGHVHKVQHNTCQAKQAEAMPREACGCGAPHGKERDAGEDEEPARSPARADSRGGREQIQVAHTRDEGARCEDEDSCGHEHGDTDRAKIRKNGIRLGLSATLFAVGLLLPESVGETLVFAVSYLVAGYPVLLAAGKKLFSRKVFDETLLMSIATIGAAALGDFAEAAAVMLLFGLGEMLQDLAVGSTRRSISSLLELRPDTANLLRDGVLETVDPATVAVGDFVVVKPYERVPLDGVVAEGDSYVDESALTGESVPSRAYAGKELLAGGINGEGALTMRVTALYADSAVNKIIKMTEEAALKKSPREKFITRFARVYTPIVVGLAALIAVVPPLLGFGTFSEWIYTALTLLVISCPCALVISVPLAFFAGLGGASRAGILVRGSTGIEALAKTGAVAFDKTGTMTKGEFTVTALAPQPGFSEGRLLEAAACAESASNHPIGRAVVARYGAPVNGGRVQDAAEIRGQGVKAVVDGCDVLVGSAQLLLDNGVPVKSAPPRQTVAHVAIDGLYAGSITLGDTVKDDAVETIEKLKEMGVETVMLTGDNAGAASAAAEELGIDRYYAGLLPADKVSHVEELKRKTAGSTVFVGDGINDAPVIAAADVGVSMGGLGSDAAIEASDVVLMTDEPRKIVTAIRASKRTLRIVSQNIVLALGIKSVIIVLGLFGFSSMWLAIIADVGVSLLAVANSARALVVANAARPRKVR